MQTRFLIKLGGRAFENENGFKELAEAILVHDDAEVMIVHGGGKEISQALKIAGRPTVFIDGIRVTQAEDIAIVEKVLSGKVNRRITSRLEKYGLSCCGMSGKTDRLFIVKPLRKKGQNFGFVGEVDQVNAGTVIDALKQGKVPVISPISADDNGKSYNVNADTAASALAVAAHCTDLVYITDVPGVCVGEETIACLSIKEARSLIADGTIQGGMVAKMESAVEAVSGNVHRVHILCWEGPKTFDRLLGRSSDVGTVIVK